MSIDIVLLSSLGGFHKFTWQFTNLYFFLRPLVHEMPNRALSHALKNWVHRKHGSHKLHSKSVWQKAGRKNLQSDSWSYFQVMENRQLVNVEGHRFKKTRVGIVYILVTVLGDDWWSEFVWHWGSSICLLLVMLWVTQKEKTMVRCGVWRTTVRVLFSDRI